MPLTEEAARRQGSSIGAGVVILLPADVCPLLEVSRVVRYLEGQGAGQCGPCVNGLDALASALETLAVQPRALRGGIADIPTLCDLVEGRGACAHPDGVARFVRTALRVFEGHADLHLQRGPCHSTRPPVLPLPATQRLPDEEVTPLALSWTRSAATAPGSAPSFFPSASASIRGAIRSSSREKCPTTSSTTPSGR